MLQATTRTGRANHSPQAVQDQVRNEDAGCRIVRTQLARNAPGDSRISEPFLRCFSALQRRDCACLRPSAEAREIRAASPLSARSDRSKPQRVEYRNLGSAGVKVSPLCLGSMTFGEADENSFMHKVGSPEAEAFEVLDTAVAAGINFLDTADVYGQDGLSERVLGRWLHAKKNRQEVVLASKFRFRMSAGPNGTGAARGRILRSVEESLRRLQTDYLDLYQIHMQDVSVREEETLRALDDLVRQGKVLYVGASNYAAYRLVDSLWHSRTSQLEQFVTLQAQYSLIERSLEREHVPLCKQWGIGLLPWSPLGRGFLSGKYIEGQKPPEGSCFAQWQERYKRVDTPRNWRIIAEVRRVAEELRASASQVSIAWLLSKPVVSSVVFGARNPGQLKETLGALSLKLETEQLQRLDAASAPELGYPYDFIKGVQGAW